MEKRRIAIQKIHYALTLVVTSVKLSNKLNFTDINIVAEDFFKDLFNLVYGYSLRNANAIRQNETAIDLYYEAEKIAFQITSQNKPAKISETVDRFIRTDKHKLYSTLIIFSITADSKCNSDVLSKLDQHHVDGRYIK